MITKIVIKEVKYYIFYDDENYNYQCEALSSEEGHGDYCNLYDEYLTLYDNPNYEIPRCSQCIKENE